MTKNGLGEVQSNTCKCLSPRKKGLVHKNKKKKQCFIGWSWVAQRAPSRAGALTWLHCCFTGWGWVAHPRSDSGWRPHRWIHCCFAGWGWVAQRAPNRADALTWGYRPSPSVT